MFWRTHTQPIDPGAEAAARRRRSRRTAGVGEQRPRSPSDAGFTLVEVSIIVMVLAVLGMILLPQMGTYLRDARLARARGDLRTIAQAVHRFLEDTGETAFWCIGNGTRETTGDDESDPPSTDPWALVGVLVSDGDIADKGSQEDEWYWRRPVDGHAVDTLSNHLVQNRPGGELWARYRTPEDLLTGIPSAQFAFKSQQGFNARHAWRGPYLSAPVSSDPWGNRYAVNVRFLDPGSDSTGWYDAGTVADVFVLSTGPDEQVDTPFEIDGVVPGDDDLILTISGGSR